MFSYPFKKTVLRLLDLQVQCFTFLRNAGNHAHQSTRLTSQKLRMFRKCFFTCLKYVYWLKSEKWIYKTHHLNTAHGEENICLCLFNGLLVETQRSVLLSQTCSTANSNNFPSSHLETHLNATHHLGFPTNIITKFCLYILPNPLWPPAFHYPNKLRYMHKVRAIRSF
jgi:hypothetical protein